jgi:hypothetical protein
MYTYKPTDYKHQHLINRIKFMREEDNIGDEENLEIKITSKGARNMGLMMIKNTLKELELCKRRLLSIRSMVSKLESDEADRILLFVTKHGLSPLIASFDKHLVELNDAFLEHLRKGLIQKKINSLSDVFAWFEYDDELINSIMQ